MDSPTFYWVGAALSACALWRLGVQAWPPPEFVEGSGAPLCLPQAGAGRNALKIEKICLIIF